MSNTVPLLILSIFIDGISSRHIEKYASDSGFDTPMGVGVPCVHIGVSHLIYGLISFLMVAGLVEKSWLDLFVSILVLIP